MLDATAGWHHLKRSLRRAAYWFAIERLDGADREVTLAELVKLDHAHPLAGGRDRHDGR